MKKLDTAKSMFVSLVAHEVKSPLAATEGWLNLILSGMLKQDAAEEHRMLQRALLRVRTLRTMVNELLSLTAIQTGNFSLKRAPVEVAAVVAEVVEANREKAAEKRIAIPCRRRPGTLPVLADRDTLSMVYANLVENAIKYSREDGHVWVSIGRPGMYVTVAVKDDGIGHVAGGLHEGVRRVLPCAQRAHGQHPGNRSWSEPCEAPDRAARGNSHRHLDPRQRERVHGEHSRDHRLRFIPMR